MELGKVIRGKTLGAWKLYSEEQKIKTPIQVLKYISILEEELEVKNSVVLADVSGRSELLVNFLTWYVHNSDYDSTEPIKAIVDDYIRLTN